MPLPILVGNLRCIQATQFCVLLTQYSTNWAPGIVLCIGLCEGGFSTVHTWLHPTRQPHLSLHKHTTPSSSLYFLHVFRSRSSLLKFRLQISRERARLVVLHVMAQSQNCSQNMGSYYSLVRRRFKRRRKKRSERKGKLRAFLTLCNVNVFF